MGCPYCDSFDVRRSHTSFGLDRIGFHRCRCRTCNGVFWLRNAQLEAVRARRRESLEAPSDPRAAPAEPGVPTPGPDETAPQPICVADLGALDEELSRRRAETPPR